MIYPLNWSRLTEILQKIVLSKTEKDSCPVHLERDGIYVEGQCRRFKEGVGNSSPENETIGRLVEESVINGGKPTGHLYLQVYEETEKGKIVSLSPNLVDLLREFIV